MTRSIVLLSLTLLTAGCGMMDGVAHRIIYPWDQVNQRIDQRGHKQPPEHMVTQELPSGGHVWISKRQDSDYTILYLHGNGESVVDLEDSGFLGYMDWRGWTHAVVDYPGVGIGGSKDPTADSLTTMGTEALTALLSVAKPGSKVIIWGRSLGAAVAAQVAYRSIGRYDALILISPWTSLEDRIRQHWLGFLVSDKFYVEHPYRTDQVCTDIEVPTLLVHGEKDRLIPADMSHSLESCFRYPTLVIDEHFGHNDIYGGEVLSHVEGFIGGDR